ncbi:MAG TPA: polyhydroxyalkanoate depolymerase [Acetobacteraceae bacterium]|nr:polyhydroxyalkanoate depolymerase [Acetobacteraceae bacterium]
MLYHAYEMQRLALLPARVFAGSACSFFETAPEFLALMPGSRLAAAALASFEHPLRRFDRPAFGLESTMINGERVAVEEQVVWQGTWCALTHFRRAVERPEDATVLLVAPLSGHHATLLRETVAAFLPDHEVFVTEWRNARDVPVSEGGFGLDDYIAHVMDFLRLLGTATTHVIAVCQPAVPVLAAVALMSEDGDPPLSMTLIGGPIDTRAGPTAVTRFAETRPLEWFRHNLIHPVPLGHRGFMRRVYPGFLQLSGFMAMNPGRHFEAHWQMFLHRIAEEHEPLAAKQRFYEEYFAVMDLPAEFYLETVSAVFQKHLLPRGLMRWRGRTVDPGAIEETALFTIEGERDDISGLGQTRAAHALCHRLDDPLRQHREQPRAGHFGLFSGRRFREQVAPAIKRFIREREKQTGAMA